MIVSKALLAVDQFNVNTVLAMAYSDGSVEFRDRTMNLLSPDENENRISSLHQIGFNFTGGRSCKFCLHNDQLYLRKLTFKNPRFAR